MLRSSLGVVRVARARRALATLAFWLVVALSLTVGYPKQSHGAGPSTRALGPTR